MSENPKDTTRRGAVRTQVCKVLCTKHHVDHLLTLILLFGIEQVPMAEMAHYLLGGGALLRSIIMILFFGEEVG